MPIRTALSQLLNVRVPLLNAPMTPQAGGALARAVSEAGAFGMLGFDEDESEDEIASQVNVLQSGAPVPFGIGLVAWVVERRPALIGLALAARPKLVSISFGDVLPYVERFQAAGIVVASQVQSRKAARAALDAGVDVLIAQGTEAGGHTGSVGTLPLLQMVLAMTDKPVLAAGGIVSGRGFAAVLAAGAAGAWVGTPFLLATESRTPAAAQAAIARSDETQTIYTSVYDRVQEKGWTSEFRGRALHNEFTRRWDGREDEMLRTPAVRAEFAAAKAAGDYSKANVYAGQSVGALGAVGPAANIVAALEVDAIRQLTACRNLITCR